jgi:hypothetical protein
VNVHDEPFGDFVEAFGGAKGSTMPVIEKYDENWLGSWKGIFLPEFFINSALHF